MPGFRKWGHKWRWWILSLMMKYEMKGELINMSQAWNKEKVWVPNKNQTHWPPELWAGTLSTELLELMESKVIKPRSRRLGGFLLCLRFIYFLSVTISKPPRMMSSSASYRPFLSSLRHIPPSGAFCQVSKLTIQTEHGGLWEMFIWSKLGQTPLEMHFRTFARIKNVT